MDQIKMEKIKYIEEVLFGQQKQASQINGGVAIIVAKALGEVGEFDMINSHDTAEDAIKNYLNGAVEGKYDSNDPAFILIAGIKGKAAVDSGNVVFVKAEPISDESTKIKFTVDCIADTPYAADIVSQQREEAAIRAAQKEHIDKIRTEVGETMGFKEKAEFLVKEISPLVSGGVKTEIPDNVYAQCLVCAEGYFKAKGI